MSKEGGTFSVARAIWDDADFPNQPFTEREAWLWLISAATWKEQTIRGPYGPISLERAEFCFAVRFLAEKWQWPKSTVHDFLGRLKGRKSIVPLKKLDTHPNGLQVYLIRKYNDFQFGSDHSPDANPDTRRTRAGRNKGRRRRRRSIRVRRSRA
jgi:hypothetical protein